MSLFQFIGLKLLPHKLKYIPYLEHLAEFNLDLCIPQYRNSPQVSSLGMNPGRGWNLDLEETYLPEYSEFEAKIFTQGTSEFYLRLLSSACENFGS